MSNKAEQAEGHRRRRSNERRVRCQCLREPSSTKIGCWLDPISGGLHKPENSIPAGRRQGPSRPGGRCTQLLRLSAQTRWFNRSVSIAFSSGSILSENPRMISNNAPSDIRNIFPFIAFSISRMRSIDITPISYNATAIVSRLSPYFTSLWCFAGMLYFPSLSEKYRYSRTAVFATMSYSYLLLYLLRPLPLFTSITACVTHPDCISFSASSFVRVFPCRPVCLPSFSRCSCVHYIRLPVYSASGRLMAASMNCCCCCLAGSLTSR